MTKLKEVHKVFRRWLHIEDVYRVDVMLATALTRKVKGTKIWLLFVGASGDAKSEMLNALDDGGMYTYTLHRVTPKVLVSGVKGAQDLAPLLNDKIVLIPDMADLLGLSPLERAELWAHLRNLYDGKAGVDTAGGKINVKYSGLNVTLIGCSTEAIDSHLLQNQNLGTRELIYRTKGNKHKERLLNKLKENLISEYSMRLELKKTVQGFLNTHEYEEREIDQETSETIFSLSEFLAMMRAQAEVEYYTGEVNNVLLPEEPTRVYKQLSRMYNALLSLDPEYDKEKAMDIIKHLVNSSGQQLRIKIVNKILQENSTNKKKTLTNKELVEKLRLNPKTILKECNILWKLGILEKETFYDSFERPIQHTWCFNEEWLERWFDL